jgi:hypothetical protein
MPAAPILTGTPVTGLLTYFALGNAATPSVVQDISDFLTNVSPSEDPDEIEATTFRNPNKRLLPGYATIGYTLTVAHSKESFAFFSALRGKLDVNFEYGPEGIEVGDTMITGTCNVFSVPDPTADVGSVTTFNVELRINTRTVGAFATTTATRTVGTGTLPRPSRPRPRPHAAA